MHSFEWFIGLILGAMLLSALARRWGVPYPTFLALGGIAIAFLPNSPNWILDPELALALFVAPVLLDAAFDASVRDLRDNWLPVTMLVLVAVGVTTAAVAFVAHWLVPGMPWSAAIALGAIVAPPDAAAATAVLRSVKLPFRILKILEGESLLNDASALLIYRVAVGAAMASSLSVENVAPAVTLALIGSPIAGYVLARMTVPLLGRITDVPTSIILQFAITFLVWIVAERLELSAILTIVAFAITVARNAPALTTARLRVPSQAVWETVVFLLNVMAFVLIGMQLRPIWSELGEGAIRLQYCIVAAIVLATVIGVRIVWMMCYFAIVRGKFLRYGYNPERNSDAPSVKSSLLISWCGMRGIVTLATAFALPVNFPYRDLILLTAFGVVLGTLVIQGLTLRPLIGWLALDDDDPVSHEMGWARRAAFHAALETLDGNTLPEADLLRLEYRQLLDQAENNPDGLTTSELPADALRLQAIEAARRVLFDMRNSGEIGDDAFHQLEQEFDRAELSAGPYMG